MNRRTRLNMFLSSVALVGALAPVGVNAEPGRVAAIRGDSMFVRDGMIRRMAVAATLQGGDRVTTGSTGQTQVDAGNATVRAGSKTDLALRKNRQGLTLNTGIVLVSNKSQSTGFDLETDQYKATSYGTMQVSYLKGKYLKVLCVEGKVKVGLKALMGDSVTLQTGQMVTITPTEERIPEPATVNLARVASTSALLGPGFVVPKLDFPGGGRVSSTIAAQEQALAQGTGRVGKNTREKSMADSNKTLGYLMGSDSNGPLPGQFQEALSRGNGPSRPATPETMYQIFYEASLGLHGNQSTGSFLRRPAGR